jgi:hypothetical protein
MACGNAAIYVRKTISRSEKRTDYSSQEETSEWGLSHV